MEAEKETDLIAIVFEAHREAGKEDLALLEWLKQEHKKTALICILNKSDLLNEETLNIKIEYYKNLLKQVLNRDIEIINKIRV